jgi:hypothetical protein
MDRAAKIAYLQERDAQRVAEARDRRAEKAKRSLSSFVQQAIAAGVVAGIAKVEWGQHLERFCWFTQLQFEGWIVAAGLGTPAMIQRQREAWERTGAKWEDEKPEPWLRYVLVQNELDNLPPGTLKSTIVMVCAVAWMWLHAPKCSFGAASGIDANVTRDSNATRDLIKSPWYRETFAIRWTTHDVVDVGLEDAATIGIRADADSVSDWATTAGGRRYSRTIQRGFTGLHVDVTLLDDPDDADKVWNESARVLPQNRFTRAIENRVNDEHKSIRKVMQQVVHAQGFHAYLLSIARWSPDKPKGWWWFCLAAEYGFQPEDAPKEGPHGPVDWRTEKGQLLHPRLSAGVLADKRDKLGPFGYEAQYNQNAKTIVSGIFERRHSRFFVLEGTNVAGLRRRPDGCPDREAQPPIVVKLSDLDRFTLSVDAANSLDPKPGAKVSAVGLLVGACQGENRFALDDRTKVLGVSGTYRAIYETLKLWPIERVLVELKALGAATINEVERSIKRGWYLDEEDKRVELVGPDGHKIRCAVEAFDPGKTSKPQRAMAMVPMWERGEFFMLDGATWLHTQVDANRKTIDEGFVGELCSFTPSGGGSRRSDRIDAASQFVARYSNTNDTVTKLLAAFGR